VIGHDRRRLAPFARPSNGGDPSRGWIAWGFAACVRAFARMSGLGEPQLFAEADDVGFNVALGEPAVELVLAEQGFEIVEEGSGAAT
jgi:hypothetical protein